MAVWACAFGCEVALAQHRSAGLGVPDLQLPEELREAGELFPVRFGSKDDRVGKGCHWVTVCPDHGIGGTDYADIPGGLWKGSQPAEEVGSADCSDE